MKKSNCCQASIVDETDLCSNCKEHCGAVVDVVELRDKLAAQIAALIHIASSCGDQGVAICIENVCSKLESLAEEPSNSKPPSRMVMHNLQANDEIDKLKKVLFKFLPADAAKEYASL